MIELSSKDERILQRLAFCPSRNIQDNVRLLMLATEPAQRIGLDLLRQIHKPTPDERETAMELYVRWTVEHAGCSFMSVAPRAPAPQPIEKEMAAVCQ